MGKREGEQVPQSGEVRGEGAETRGEVYGPCGVDDAGCVLGQIGVDFAVEAEIGSVEFGREDGYCGIGWRGRGEVGRGVRRKRGLEARAEGFGDALVGC